MMNIAAKQLIEDMNDIAAAMSYDHDDSLHVSDDEIKKQMNRDANKKRKDHQRWFDCLPLNKKIEYLRLTIHGDGSFYGFV